MQGESQTGRASQRIDAAHLRPQPASARRVSLADEAQPSDAALEIVHRVRAQATQLARHLQERQQRIDHRESELNARAAQLEREIRQAELWFTDRSGEETRIAEPLDSTTVAPQAEQLEARHRELDARQAQVYADIETVSEQRAALVAEQQELERRTSELQAQEKRWATVETELRVRQAELEQRGRELQQRQDAQAVRQRQLAALAPLLEVDRRAHAEAERALQHQQQQFHKELVTTRAKLQSDRETLEADLREQHRHLRERRRAVEARAVPLERREEAVERSRRETLEIRLATEELWAELAGTLAPNSLKESLEEARARLAGHYGQAEQEFAARAEQFEKYRAELAAELAEIESQRDTLQQWVEGQQSQIEEQAALLVAREQELDRRQAEMAEAAAQWATERASLQQQLFKQTEE